MASQIETQEIPGLEFDILEYLIPVLENWKLIVTTAIAAAIIVWCLLSERENLYEAFATITAVNSKDIGGVSPDERRAPEVITLVEHGFVMNSMRDNQLQTTLARLESRAFTTYFIENYGIQQAFHPDKWDEERRTWKAAAPPSIGTDRKRFVEQVRVIEHNPDNDIIRVAMRWNTPAAARDWANDYVKAFNEYMRDRALEEVSRRMGFLQNKLQSNDIVEVDKSIYRLMEAQTAVAMLAKSRDEYAVEVLDPAILPYGQHNMSEKKLAGLSGIGSALLVCFLIMARVLQRKLQTELNRFMAGREPDPRITP